MAQMKSLTIKDEELKAAGYEIEEAKEERGTFYFISRKGHKKVEILKRKEMTQKGKIIVLTRGDIKYFGAVKVSTTKFGNMELKGYIPSMEIIIP